MFAGLIVSACVLCTVAIIKSGDKNLIDGRAKFKAKTEILSLDFCVNINRSSYICKSCLNKSRKRRFLISNLRAVNAPLQELLQPEVQTRLECRWRIEHNNTKLLSAAFKVSCIGSTITRKSSSLRHSS